MHKIIISLIFATMVSLSYGVEQSLPEAPEFLLLPCLETEATFETAKNQVIEVIKGLETFKKLKDCNSYLIVKMAYQLSNLETRKVKFNINFYLSPSKDKNKILIELQRIGDCVLELCEYFSIIRSRVNFETESFNLNKLEKISTLSTDDNLEFDFNFNTPEFPPPSWEAYSDFTVWLRKNGRIKNSINTPISYTHVCN